MTATRFDVVFQKLAEAGQDAPHATVESVRILQSEYDEIDELRRLALEMSEPEPQTARKGRRKGIMTRTRAIQHTAQVAGIICQHIIGDVDGVWSDEEARKINDGDGWGFDVRYSDEDYTNDTSWTRVTGVTLSDEDLETAIRDAHLMAGF